MMFEGFFYKTSKSLSAHPPLSPPTGRSAALSAVVPSPASIFPCARASPTPPLPCSPTCLCTDAAASPPSSAVTWSEQGRGRRGSSKRRRHGVQIGPWRGRSSDNGAEQTRASSSSSSLRAAASADLPGGLVRRPLPGHLLRRPVIRQRRDLGRTKKQRREAAARRQREQQRRDRQQHASTSTTTTTTGGCSCGTSGACPAPHSTSSPRSTSAWTPRIAGRASTRPTGSAGTRRSSTVFSPTAHPLSTYRRCGWEMMSWSTCMRSDWGTRITVSSRLVIIKISEFYFCMIMKFVHF